MALTDYVKPKPAEDLFSDTMAESRAARETTVILQMEMLPSEESAAKRLAREAAQRVEYLEAVGRYRGEIDLGGLLRQQREGPAPRWFIYNPLFPCDTIQWGNGEKIDFEYLRERTVIARRWLSFRNPLSGKGLYRASTILLPARIREQIRRLQHERIDPYILFEPASIVHEEIKPPRPERPDPALIVERGGRWFLVDCWDDPAVEDPRALNTLREFYVGKRGAPDWWSPADGSARQTFRPGARDAK